MLDHIVTDNTRKNKNHHRDAIENDPNFDSKFSLYRGIKDPLPVVNASLRGGKKQMEMMISVSTCLWGSGATNSMIKIKYTRKYKCIIRSNKSS